MNFHLDWVNNADLIIYLQDVIYNKMKTTVWPFIQEFTIKHSKQKNNKAYVKCPPTLYRPLHCYNTIWAILYSLRNNYQKNKPKKDRKARLLLSRVYASCFMFPFLRLVVLSACKTTQVF